MNLVNLSPNLLEFIFGNLSLKLGFYYNEFKLEIKYPVNNYCKINLYIKFANIFALLVFFEIK